MTGEVRVTTERERGKNYRRGGRSKILVEYLVSRSQPTRQKVYFVKEPSMRG